MSDSKRRWWQRKPDDRRLIGMFEPAEVQAILELARKRGVDAKELVNQLVEEAKA